MYMGRLLWNERDIREIIARCNMWHLFGFWFEKANKKYLWDNWENLKTDKALDLTKELLFGHGKGMVVT